MLLPFCFRFRASSGISILVNFLINFSSKFAFFPTTEFSARPVSTAPLTFLDLDEKFSSLSLSPAAAFVSARIKASLLGMPGFKYSLISLITYGIALSLSRVLRKSCWTKLRSHVMSSDSLVYHRRTRP